MDKFFKLSAEFIIGFVLGILFFVLQFAFYKVALWMGSWGMIIHFVNGFLVLFFLWITLFSVYRGIKRKRMRKRGYITNLVFLITILFTLWYLWFRN